MRTVTCFNRTTRKIKKAFSSFLASAVAVTALFTMSVYADFAKTKQYTDGQFTDVPAAEWYAQSVKDAADGENADALDAYKSADYEGGNFIDDILASAGN